MTSTSRRVAKPKATTSKPQDQEDLPGLLLFGDFPMQVTIIPRALCTLIMNMGVAEEAGGRRHVLLPHIEVKFGGIRQGNLDEQLEPDDQQLEELFSRILPLENALWLLSDMASDIRLACLRLKSVASNSDLLEPVRIGHARDYAERLRQEAELAAALLDELIVRQSGGEAHPSSQEPAVRKRPTRPRKRNG